MKPDVSDVSFEASHAIFAAARGKWEGGPIFVCGVEDIFLSQLFSSPERLGGPGCWAIMSTGARTVKDVPADKWIAAMAKHLKSGGKVRNHGCGTC